MSNTDLHICDLAEFRNEHKIYLFNAYKETKENGKLFGHDTPANYDEFVATAYRDYLDRVSDFLVDYGKREVVQSSGLATPWSVKVWRTISSITLLVIMIDETVKLIKWIF